MKKIFTIPNILSIVRILLIPVFIVLYLIGRQGENIYLMISVAVVALSGFTDILDGIIARKCNMVSDLGKVLDPVADKLTQAAVAICLAIDNPIVIPMFVVFAVKESAMMIGALTLYKSTERRPISAKWYGKMSTVILYAVMMLIIINSIYEFIPGWIITALVIIATLSIIFSVINYYLLFRTTIREEKSESHSQSN